MRKFYHLFGMMLVLLMAVPNLNAQVLWAPNSLTGTIEGQNIDLEWESAGPFWNFYGTGENENAIGLTDKSEFEALIRFLPEDLSAYVGAAVTKASFLLTENATYKFRIYNRVDNTLNLLHEIEVPEISPNQYFELEFPEAVMIEETSDLYFAIAASNYAGSPVSSDESPTAIDRGDLIFFGDTQSSLSANGIVGNWNIKVYFDNPPSKSIAQHIISTKEIHTNGELLDLNISRTNLAVDQSAFENRNTNDAQGYNVYRNGEMFNAELISGTTFSNSEVPFGYSKWSVTAVYEEGESSPSAEITLSATENWVAKENVILEMGTGTWCPYCPGAAMAAEEFKENENDFVAVIEYHAANGDTYETPECLVRLDFYGITSFPTSVFDGTSDYGGGSSNQNIYPALKPLYDEEIAKMTPFEVAMTHSYDEVSRELEVTATVNLVGTKIHQDLAVFMCLTESGIKENWQGQTELHSVMRKMLPNADGTAVEFPETPTEKTVTETYTVPSSWVDSEMEVIVWIQDKTTKEILGSTYAAMAPTGINTIIEGNTYKMYPNPVANELNITSENTIQSVQICNINGQVINTVNVLNNEVKINTTALNTGIYLVKVMTANGLEISKFLKK